MTTEVLIDIENVGKKFCRSLNQSMIYGLRDIINDIRGHHPDKQVLRKHEFWSIDGVSTIIHRGDCLAVIGPNGSGKSTLMKMISGIYRPDYGDVIVRGRVCSLLEVGAGFHPLLTGRENIYLNAAILGLSRDEIDMVYGNIVRFSGIEEYIDMPVKTYSSGMFVRLGFSIAVHSRPDILVIDEVLAVGDAGFRARCYNKIHELAAHTAILFVSHSMEQVSRVATRVMVLNDGQVIHEGEVVEGINVYNRLFAVEREMQRYGSGEIRLSNISVNETHGKLQRGSRFLFACQLEPKLDASDVLLSVIFRDMNDDAVLELNGSMEKPAQLITVNKNKSLQVMIEVDSLTLNPGLYSINVLLTSGNKVKHYDWIKNCMSVEVSGSAFGTAPVQLTATWTIMAVTE